MDLRKRYGNTALIAGASEGIGAAFARYLAARGIDLILIARRPEPLENLADELKKRFEISVKCIRCDLSSDRAAEQIELELAGKEIDILIYNAAVSEIGPFTANSRQYLEQAPWVNMITPMRMVYHHGRMMTEKRKGAVIIISSMAGLQGSGFLSVYGASKAFGRVLAESLWYEWKDFGVDVLACVAGATSTPGYLRSDPGKKVLFAPRVLQPPEIPQECFRYLGRQPSFIAGRGNRIASFLMHRILSSRLAVKIMGDNTRKMYRFR